MNHVYYPCSHQRNSERPNAANDCSCWQIQPQTHSNCMPWQLWPPRRATVTVSTGDSAVYLRFICKYTAGRLWVSCQPLSARKQKETWICWCFWWSLNEKLGLKRGLKWWRSFKKTAKSARATGSERVKPDGQMHRLALVSIWVTHPGNISPEATARLTNRAINATIVSDLKPMAGSRGQLEAKKVIRIEIALKYKRQKLWMLSLAMFLGMCCKCLNRRH